jgi:hypothetical protein
MRRGCLGQPCIEVEGLFQNSSWLKHYVTSWKAVCFNPDEVIEFCFYLPNPSSCTIALELIQPLTEMSTRNLPEG